MNTNANVGGTGNNKSDKSDKTEASAAGTSPASILAPASTLPPSSLSLTMTELNRRRQELQAEIESLTKAQEEHKKKDEEVKMEIIKTLPTLLGFADGHLGEVINLLKGYADSPTWKSDKPRDNTRRAGRPYTIMAGIKEQALSLRRKGWKTEDIAKKLNVSVASCWLWFRRAGLSHSGIGGQKRVAAAA